MLRLRAVLADGGSGGAAEVASVLEELARSSAGNSPSSIGGADCPQLQDAPHPCVQLLQAGCGATWAQFSRGTAATRAAWNGCAVATSTPRATAGRRSTPSCPALLPQVTSWYEERPQSCFLYVCNVCFTQYGGSVSALAPTFAESFGRMATATFRVLSASPSALLDSPDIVDDFFELCSKVLRRMPALLLESEALTTLFHCGCAGLHVQHREANRSVVSFFETLVPLCKGGEHSHCVSPAGLEALLRLLTQHGAQVGGHARRARRCAPGRRPAARRAHRRPRRVTRSWCTRSSSGSPACSPPLASASMAESVLKMLCDIEPASRAWVGQALAALPSAAQPDSEALVEALFGTAHDVQSFTDAVAGAPILRAAPLCHLAPDMPRLLRSVQHRLQAEANRGRLADASRAARARPLRGKACTRTRAARRTSSFTGSVRKEQEAKREVVRGEGRRHQEASRPS